MNWNGFQSYASNDLVPAVIGGTATATIINQFNRNNVDPWHYMPSPAGVWTIVLDDYNPANPIVASLTTGDGTSATLVAGPANVESGGVLVGQTWTYNIQMATGVTANWGFPLTISLSRTGISGNWTWDIENFFLFAPGNAPNRNVPLALDQNVANWVTTPSGKTAYSLRWVDSCTFDYADTSNTVNATDIKQPTSFSWAAAVNDGPLNWPRLNVPISTIRTYNISTSPSVLLSQWSGTSQSINSIRVNNCGLNYSSPTITVTGGGGGSGLVLGTPVVSGGVVSFAISDRGSGYTSVPTVEFSGGGGSGAVAIAEVAGESVYAIYVLYPGSGYTSAPTVSFSGGGGSNAAATCAVSNIIQSIPVTNGGSGYTTPPLLTIKDSTGTGADVVCVAEFSPASISWINFTGLNTGWWCGEAVCPNPHGLKWGQSITVNGSGSFPVSNGSSNTVTASLIGVGAIQVFPTSATTFAFTTYGTVTAGTGNGLAGNINNVSGSNSVTYTFTIEVPDISTVPYEAAAVMTGQLKNSNLWINVPFTASDLAVASIAQRIRDNFPRGRKVYVEFSNENWNFTQSAIYMYGTGAIGAYGTIASLGIYGLDAYVVRSGQVHDIFVTVFNEADIHGNLDRGIEIQRVIGSFFAGPSTTTAIVGACNAYSVQMDCLAVAPYIDVPSETTSPTTALTCNVTGGASTGGNLPAGTYNAYYTYIEAASGIESNVGSSAVQFTSSSGNIPELTLPTYPVWAASANIYLTAASGAAGTETLYATGITGTTTTLPNADWDNNTVSQSSAASPPAVNESFSANWAAACVAINWPTSAAYGSGNPAWAEPCITNGCDTGSSIASR